MCDTCTAAHMTQPSEVGGAVIGAGRRGAAHLPQGRRKSGAEGHVRTFSGICIIGCVTRAAFHSQPGSIGESRKNTMTELARRTGSETKRTTCKAAARRSVGRALRRLTDLQLAALSSQLNCLANTKYTVQEKAISAADDLINALITCFPFLMRIANTESNCSTFLLY